MFYPCGVPGPSTSAHLKSGGLALPERVRDRQDDVGDALDNGCTKAKAPKRHAERRAVLFPPEAEACPKAANEGNTEILCLLIVIWNL